MFQYSLPRRRAGGQGGAGLARRPQSRLRAPARRGARCHGNGAQAAEKGGGLFHCIVYSIFHYLYFIFY